MLIALDHFDQKAAMRSILAWPHNDLATTVIVAHRDLWSASDWQIFPDTAEVLDHEKPLAATILYRVLLDDILACARSNANRNGALDRPDDLDTHATYRAHLRGITGGSQILIAAREPHQTRGTTNSGGQRPTWYNKSKPMSSQG